MVAYQDWSLGLNETELDMTEREQRIAALPFMPSHCDAANG